MESPIRRTRGRFVSLAWEIQMSHHSMASRAGGAAVAIEGGNAMERITVEIAVSNNRRALVGMTITSCFLIDQGGLGYLPCISVVASSSEIRAVSQATHDSPKSSARGANASPFARAARASYFWPI